MGRLGGITEIWDPTDEEREDRQAKVINLLEEERYRRTNDSIQSYCNWISQTYETEQIQTMSLDKPLRAKQEGKKGSSKSTDGVRRYMFSR